MDGFTGNKQSSPDSTHVFTEPVISLDLYITPFSCFRARVHYFCSLFIAPRLRFQPIL